MVRARDVRAIRDAQGRLDELLHQQDRDVLLAEDAT